MKLTALLAALLISGGLRAQAPTHTTLTLAPGDTVIVIAAKDTTPASLPSGPTHEPSGMLPQINTGHVSAANTVWGPSGSSQQFTIAGPIRSTWTTWSPTTANSLGECRCNLSTANGITVTYPTNVAGGNSPVRFGVGIPNAGTGMIYSRERVRFASYIMSNTANGPKMWEPRTLYSGGATGENHVIGGRSYGPGSPSATLFMPFFFLQGPNGQSRNLAPTVANPINIADGGTHTVEMLEVMETPAGSATGTQDTWIDGVLQAHYANVQYLASGQTPGWPYWMADPTYGGAPATEHPPHQWSVTHDSLYVSVK